MKKTEYQLEVINKLRDLRNDNNLSQAGLSDILGISYGLVGNIESLKFEHKYTLKQIVKICDHFQYPIERIFLNEDEVIDDCSKYVEILIKKIAEYE